MIPVLFQIGPVKVYSYGLMLGIGFLLGSYVLSLELKRKRLDPGMASTITVLGVIFGISGAKLLFLLEEWNEFVRNPLGMTFSPGGLTWYGGLFLGVLAVYVYLRRRRVPSLKVWDGIGLGLMLGYGVARLGCHFSGDGDYGFPTNLPWGTDYSRGTYPPSKAFAIFPEITRHYPGGVVPDTTLCHPTPVYEMLLGVIGFAILWHLRKKSWQAVRALPDVGQPLPLLRGVPSPESPPHVRTLGGPAVQYPCLRDRTRGYAVPGPQACCAAAPRRITPRPLPSSPRSGPRTISVSSIPTTSGSLP